VKKSFLLTYRGPDFTQPFCERHFPGLEINRVNARTVDRTGTKMAFLNHERQLRTSQWVTAVEDYNKEAPAHLKIHWAGTTEAEHIRVSESRRRLNSTTAYKHIMQKKDDTYIEWSNGSKALVGKPPLKSLESNLALPYKTPSDSFKRKPKRVYETMNEDEIYKNMVGVEECKRARKPVVSYDTETDDNDEVDEPVTRGPPSNTGSYNTESASPVSSLLPYAEALAVLPNAEALAVLPNADALAVLPNAEALAVPRVVRVRVMQPGEVRDDSIPWAYAVHAMARRMESPVPQPEVAEPLPQVAEPLPEVAEPMPQVAEPLPQVAEPLPQVAEPLPEVAEPLPQVAEPQPEIAEPLPGVPKPQPEIAEPLPGVPKPQPEQQQGTSVSGDLVSLTSLNVILQPLFNTVNYLTTSALTSKDHTIAMLAHQLGIPVPP
jgi:hypothetical protein